MCSALRFCLDVYDDLSPCGIVFLLRWWMVERTIHGSARTVPRPSARRVAGATTSFSRRTLGVLDACLHCSVPDPKLGQPMSAPLPFPSSSPSLADVARAADAA